MAIETPSATPRGTMKAESLRSGSPMFPRPAPNQVSIPAHQHRTDSNSSARSTSTMPKVLETSPANRTACAGDGATWQVTTPTVDFGFRAQKTGPAKAGKSDKKQKKRKKSNWCACFGSVDSDSEQDEKENRQVNIMRSPPAERLMGLDLSKEAEEQRQREQEQELLRRALVSGGKGHQSSSDSKLQMSPLVQDHARPDSALDGVQFSFKEASLSGSSKQLQVERASQPADLSHLQPPPPLGSPPTSPPAPPLSTPQAAGSDRKPHPSPQPLNCSAAAVKPPSPSAGRESVDRVSPGNRCTGPSLMVPQLDAGRVSSTGVKRRPDLDLQLISGSGERNAAVWGSGERNGMEGGNAQGLETEGGVDGGGPEAEGGMPESSLLVIDTEVDEEVAFHIARAHELLVGGSRGQTPRQSERRNSGLGLDQSQVTQNQSPKLSLSPLSILPDGDVRRGAAHEQEGEGMQVGKGPAAVPVLYDEQVMQIYDEDLISTVSTSPMAATCNNSLPSSNPNGAMIISDEDMLCQAWFRPGPGHKASDSDANCAGVSASGPGGPGVSGAERNMNSQRRGPGSLRGGAGSQPPRSGSLQRIFS